jgi:predicted AlkP superfamily pyrophosphatase or phosphodiesterase
MRYAWRFTLARFSACLGCSLAIVAGFTSRPVWAAPAEHVVVISLDGMPGYMLDDPKALLPNIRALARQGVQAHGGMRVSNPSVTWPNHTSMVTGVQPRRHGVLANGVLVRGAPGEPITIDPKRDKTELMRVPTVFDAAHAAHLTTAGIQWPCTRNADGLDDCIADVPDCLKYATPRLLKELTAEGILPDESDALAHSKHSYVWFDDFWTKAACYVIRQHKPNLLLMHLLLTDTIHHANGPQTQQAYLADAYADDCVGRVLAALDAAGIRDRTAVFIVADHGFTTTPKALLPNSLLREEGWLKATRPGKVEDARAYVVPEGGVGLLYVTDPATDEATRAKIRDLFVGKEGIEEVLGPDKFAENGLPDVRDWPQMSDMVLVAKDGYCFGGTADEERWVAPNTQVGASIGSHGFLATNPKMNAIFVAAGAGLRRGVTLEGVENVDVAPTVAHLLGIQFGNIDGKVLKEAVVQAGP